jgi:hypothetical protein
MSWDCSVGMTTNYGLDGGVLFPAGSRNFSVLYSIQKSSGTHPHTHQMGTVGKLLCDHSKGASTLLVFVLVLARLVLVWLLLVLVNLRPHYISCSPGFGA